MASNVWGHPAPRLCRPHAAEWRALCDFEVASRTDRTYQGFQAPYWYLEDDHPLLSFLPYDVAVFANFVSPLFDDDYKLLHVLPRYVGIDLSMCVLAIFEVYAYFLAASGRYRRALLISSFICIETTLNCIAICSFSLSVRIWIWLVLSISRVVVGGRQSMLTRWRMGLTPAAPLSDA